MKPLCQLMDRNTEHMTPPAAIESRPHNPSAAGQTATHDATHPPHHWKAELELRFEAIENRTRLIHRRHYGPLMVQRPFYPEPDGTCHIYLLHPPGGIAGGDDLQQKFHLGHNARCVFTTPGATKFYRSATGKGSMRTLIALEAGAVCEYFPQEAIAFDGAQAEIETCIELAADAHFLGWDFVCLGRPAAHERFNNGTITQRIAISNPDGPLWFERFHLPGNSPLQNAPYALAGRTVFGTMLYAGPMREGLAELVRNAMDQSSHAVFSVSQLEKVLVCRYLGDHAEEGKKLFSRAWDVLRSALQSKRASAPRIWAT